MALSFTSRGDQSGILECRVLSSKMRKIGVYQNFLLALLTSGLSTGTLIFAQSLTSLPSVTYDLHQCPSSASLQQHKGPSFHSTLSLPELLTCSYTCHLLDSGVLCSGPWLPAESVLCERNCKSNPFIPVATVSKDLEHSSSPILSYHLPWRTAPGYINSI